MTAGVAPVRQAPAWEGHPSHVLDYIIPVSAHWGRSGVWEGFVFLSIRMVRESLGWMESAPFNNPPHFPRLGVVWGASGNLLGSSWALLGSTLRPVVGRLGLSCGFLGRTASGVKEARPIPRPSRAPGRKSHHCPAHGPSPHSAINRLHVRIYSFCHEPKQLQPLRGHV